MGLYFSNFHIRKEADNNKIKNFIVSYFAEKGCVVSDSENADFDVTVYAPANSAWISVCSEAFTHIDVLDLAPLVARETNSAVLGAACFDSDYMFLNLVDVEKNVDAWLNIGKSYEIKSPRRSSVASWKNSVLDYPKFKAASQGKYVFAEEFLASAGECLELSFEQATGIELGGEAEKLYFSSPAGEEKMPTSLEIRSYGSNPALGEQRICFVNNEGDSSKGIVIVFFGPYVEHDEITIAEAEFSYTNSMGERIYEPIEFEKVYLNNQWAYIWKDPDFKIPSRVPDELPPKVKHAKEFERSFGIRYTLEGSQRKILDVAIAFIPLSNSINGQCIWYVWMNSESKREFIERHNKRVDEARMYGVKGENYMNPDDYDLD